VHSRPRSSRIHAFNMHAIPALVLALLVWAVFTGTAAAENDTGSEGKPKLGPAAESHHANEVRTRTVAGRYIVVLEDHVEGPEAVARSQARERGGKLGFVYRSAIKGYSVSGLSAGDARALRNRANVKYVVPDRKIELHAQTVPFGISRIFAATNPALDIDEVDDARINVDVAVIDSGIDPTHPDLNVYARYDCVPPGEGSGSGYCTSGGTDGSGHGTHVAGTVGAIDNGFGVVGVAPGARLWGIRVLNNEGFGYDSWVTAGIDLVSSKSTTIEVANMSLGGFGANAAQDAAISNSVNKGVVYAVAASNDRLNADAVSPARHPDVITVSAMSDYDGLPGGEGSPTCGGTDDGTYWWSNWGTLVEVAAPGVCVLSTVPGGGYATKSGTSMASPHVAGAAALLSSKANPSSRADVEAIRTSLVNGGSLDWTDTSEDRKPEPLLYLGGQPLSDTEAATGGWGSIAKDEATLYGALNARGLATTYQFEYGPTTSYGFVAPSNPKSLPAGTKYTTVSEGITNLDLEQTYHYRLVATNAQGTFHGGDRTLSTSRWSVATPETQPPTTDGEWLNEISCGATFCAAVGHYFDGVNRTFAFTRSGTGPWKWTSIPLPAGMNGSEIEGVSCSTATACTAVGQKYDSVTSYPMAAHWNGTAWSSQTISAPTGSQYAKLIDVSCPTSNYCVAVGYYKNASGVWVNYSLLYNGGAWYTLSTPNAADSAESELDGVSCTAIHACTAVGWYVAKSGGTKPVIARWNGATWSLQTPARTGGSLASVSCVSTSFCMAVGADSETWNGSQWTAHSVPAPGPGNAVDLQDVTCTTASACTAVGNFAVPARTRGVVELWNGASWTDKGVARRSELRDRLWGVACVPMKGCAAVGEGTGAVSDSLIEVRKDVETGPATGVGPAGGTVTGTVNPRGFVTDYYFEYGKTPAFGQKAPVPSGSVPGDAQDADVTAHLTGLDPETTYHYRLVAVGSPDAPFGETTAQGDSLTFQTSAPAHHQVSTFGTAGSNAGELQAPWGLDVDAQGNIWVADAYNHRVQKFSSSGTFLTQFGTFGTGNGQFKEPLDIAVALNGDLLVTDGANNRVQRFNSNGQYLSQFGKAGTGDGQFTEPWGIDVAANGDVWVVDARYYRVQQFTSGGSFIRKVSGFEGPRGIAIDSSGNVWVTESGAGKVHKLSAAGTKLAQFTLPGTEPAPQAIDVKPSGHLIVADRWGDEILQFSPEGELVGEFGGGQIVEPRGVATAPGGVVYVSNTWRDGVEIWRQAVPTAVTQDPTEVATSAATLNAAVNPNGADTSYWFQYGKTSSYGSQVPISPVSIGSGSAPVSVSETLSGLEPETVYHYRVVADSSGGTTYGSGKAFATRTVTPTGLPAFGSQGSGPGEFETPVGIAADQAGDVWVADGGPGLNRIQKFDQNGNFLLQVGSTGSGPGQFKTPSGIAATSNSDIWVVDAGNQRVQRFNSKGEYQSQFGGKGSGNGQFLNPVDIAVAPDGSIWVSDDSRHDVQKFTSNGTFISKAGGYGSGNGRFIVPQGIATDSAGNLWVADRWMNRVQKLSATGTFLSKFGVEGSGPGQLHGPRDIAIRSNGTILVSDLGNGRIQNLTPDGYLLAEVQQPNPQFIAMGAAGKFYVPEAGTSSPRVWVWSLPASPEATTGAPSGPRTTEATLNGTVNPSGAETTYWFQWGTTTGYGNNTSKTVGSGAEPLAVSQTISGLSLDAEYHYRVVAESSEGIAYGQDVTLLTSGPSGLGFLPVIQPFNGSASSIEKFANGWSALGWAAGETPKGQDTTTGWRAVAAHPTVNGAYYEPVVSDGGQGVGAAVTVAVAPSAAGQHFSLWLDASGAGASRSGYELRFTSVSPSSWTYNVTLSKWVTGSQSILASKSEFQFPVGFFGLQGAVGLVDKGGTVSAWTRWNTSPFSELLSVGDSAFNSGNAGVEAAGNATRLKNFKAGTPN
jgi:subtilisin family serine protease/streptogramin lyase